MRDAQDTVTISFEDLRALLKRIFQTHGASESVAAILADNCAACERDGCHSPSVFRMPAFERLRDRIASMIAATGIAVVAIRNAHHFSEVWPELDDFARDGNVGLSLVTGATVEVPPGGRKRVLGTNPVAFATCNMFHVDLRGFALSFKAQVLASALRASRSVLPTSWICCAMPGMSAFHQTSGMTDAPSLLLTGMCVATTDLEQLKLLAICGAIVERKQFSVMSRL